MFEFFPAASCCVYAIVFPSADQIGPVLLRFLGVPVVRARYRLVSTSIRLISKLAELRGFDMYARYRESGDHAWPSSATSGVLVKFRTSPVCGETRNKSHCSSPS